MMALVAHAPAGVNLVAGNELLIKYVGFPEWHARLLLAEVGNGLWVVVTPDGDVFPEDLKANNRDIDGWRLHPCST